ncbi:LysR family transcriptional regulator [Clostridium sp. P21]|uniref:LysR family transcriptional regulator n=1 Tax=Clostridium muellerianum TaxID=2716538 RepID=A0A7Y0EGP6_9CLOT|nr:LysR family transcriptional regulator [Clostridium muellerianum]NMM62802.1 LysR family transcriptional regulator [Clostridium muellerianum]
MDIKQLKYFLTIAREGTLTKASKKLHIAQPPLSYQLKMLENEIGIKLIERTTRKSQLTDAGKFLYNRGEQIVELVETTLKELKDFNEGIEGTLAIGTIASTASMLPEKINKFHKIYPKVNFQIREGGSSRILDLLNNGIIQIGIIRHPFDSKNLKSKCLCKEHMLAATHDNFISSSKKKINLITLKNSPLIVHVKFKSMIVDACSELDFKPNIFCESDDVRSMLTWATTGMGIAIVPNSAVNLIPNINLKYKEITNPTLVTKISLVWLNNSYVSTTMKNFLKILT